LASEISAPRTTKSGKTPLLLAALISAVTPADACHDTDVISNV
jgi:hypothetical protein